MNNFDDFISSLNPEQMKKLAEALEAAAPKTAKPRAKAKPKTAKTRTQSVTETFTTIKESSGGRTPVKFKKNSWKDTGEFGNEEETKTPKYEPTPRSREKAKKVEVECHVCGKAFFEDPRYMYGEYLRCSKCGRK